MKSFAVTSKSFHLYDAFKKECESMGVHNLGGFYKPLTPNESKYNMYLADKYDVDIHKKSFEDVVDNIPLFHLENQWDEAIEMVKDFKLSKKSVETPKTDYEVNLLSSLLDMTKCKNEHLEESCKKDETIANLQQKLKEYVKEIEDRDKCIEFHNSQVRMMNEHANELDRKKLRLELAAIDHKSQLDIKLNHLERENKALKEDIASNKDYMDKYNTVCLERLNMRNKFKWKIERVFMELDYLNFFTALFTLKPTIKSIKEILNEKLI